MKIFEIIADICNYIVNNEILVLILTVFIFWKVIKIVFIVLKNWKYEDELIDELTELRKLKKEYDKENDIYR